MYAFISVLDLDMSPDQDTLDPHVLGLLDPEPDPSIYYNQAKILRKTMILTVLRLLLDFISLKNDENVPSKSI